MAHSRQYEPVVTEQAVEPQHSPPTAPAIVSRPNKPLGKFSTDAMMSRIGGIYWVSPFKMVFFLLVGILMSVGHHVYYQSRVGKVVGNENDQQNEHR